MQKNQTWIPSHIVYKNKGIKNLNVRLKTIEILEENVGSTLFGISLSTIVWLSPHRKRSKTKINKWDRQTKSLPHSKGSCQHSKKTAYWMKEDICKWYIWLGVNIQSLRKKKKNTQVNIKRKKKKGMNERKNQPDLKVDRESE